MKDNPYHLGTLSHEVWEVCIRRDIEAFWKNDWSICEDDFIAEGFVGWDAHKESNPSKWTIGFHDLPSYQACWERGAEAFHQMKWSEGTREGLYHSIRLSRVQQCGDLVIAHKVLDGELRSLANEVVKLDWQSLFQLKKVSGGWKQCGFIGYLPLTAS